MELKEYSMEQLNEILKKMKEQMQVLEENIGCYQNYIASHEEKIQVAKTMLEESRKTFERLSDMVQKIVVEKVERNSYSNRLFSIEDVYLMCFEKRIGDQSEGCQTFARGLIPHLLKYDNILVGYEEKEENGEIKGTPIYEQRQSFTKNPDNIHYEFEEHILASKNVTHSTLYPGVPLKDVILDMKENGESSILEQDQFIGYEKIKEIARYAYENWNEKNGWKTGKEDFFQTTEKQKKKTF